MSIKQAFEKLELHGNSYTDTVKNKLFEDLDSEINADYFDLKGVMATDIRYVRVFLSMMMNDDTLKRFADEKIVDSKLPTFMAHTLLMAASGKSCSDMYINQMVRIIKHHQAKMDDPGTTLGYALGFVIGKSLYYGEDANEMVKLCNDTIIKDKKVFTKGVNAGFNSASNDIQGLAKDKNYIKSIAERYSEHWNEASMVTCFKAVRHTYNLDTKSPLNINANNLAAVEFLEQKFNADNSMTTILQLHTISQKFQGDILQDPRVQKLIEIQIQSMITSKVNEGIEVAVARKTASLTKKHEGEINALNLQRTNEVELLNQKIVELEQQLAEKKEKARFKHLL